MHFTFTCHCQKFIKKCFQVNFRYANKWVAKQLQPRYHIHFSSEIFANVTWSQEEPSGEKGDVRHRRSCIMFKPEWVLVRILLNYSVFFRTSYSNKATVNHFLPVYRCLQSTDPCLHHLKDPWKVKRRVLNTTQRTTHALRWLHKLNDGLVWRFEARAAKRSFLVLHDIFQNRKIKGASSRILL